MNRRVLFYHCGDDWIRGSEVVLLGILERIDRTRFEPLLVCNQEIMARAARQRAGVEARLIDIPEVMWDGPDLSLQFGGWLRTVARLLAMVRSERVSLLYCNSGLPSQTGYFAARLAGIPMVCHLHCPYNLRYALLYRFHRADATIFVSDYIRRSIGRKIRFRHTARVIYNGIDVERFTPPASRDPALRAELGLNPGDVVVGQVGSLIPRKGIDLLIRAVATLTTGPTPVKLVLVGDGPDREAYRALGRELGAADRVIFAGQRDDPVPFYQHVFDLNVLASRGEAMGLTLLEGGACGLPSLGAEAEGIPEAVVGGETGLLFPSDDHRALAEGLATLAADPGLRARLGRRAREVVCQRFSMARHIAEIESVIASAAGGRPA